LVTNILQNNFLYVPHNNENNTYLGQLEGEESMTELKYLGPLFL